MKKISIRLFLLTVLGLFACTSWAIVMGPEESSSYLRDLSRDPLGDSSAFYGIVGSLERGEHVAARAQLDELHKEHPDSPGVWELEGVLNIVSGDASAAEQALRKAVELAPQSASIRAKLGSSLIMQGRINEGLEHVEKAVSIDPNNVLGQHILARTAVSQGNIDAAEEHYRAATASLAKLSKVHEELANLLVRMGRTKEARHVLESVVTIQSGPAALLQLARIQAMAGDDLATQQTLERATTHYADQPLAWSGRIGTLLEMGRANAAREVAKAALEHHSSSPVLVFQLANAYQALGQRDEAIDLYRTLTDAAGGVGVGALNNLAVMLVEKPESRAEAVSFARQALRAAPESPEVKDTLGWALYRNGDARQALEHLQAAVADRPDDPGLICHLGIVRAHVEGVGSASGELERCVKLGRDEALVRQATALLN